MQSLVHRIVFLFILGTCPITVFAEDWTSFRNGGASKCESPLATSSSPTSGISWQQELSGYGQSSPVIANGHVYVTSVEGTMCETCVIESFCLKSGELKWRFTRFASFAHPSNYMNARSAPTPIADESGVYAFFETGDFVALQHDGKERWHRNEAKDFGRFENNHGIGSSPTHDKRHLYLCVEHDGPSFVVSIDKKSGDTVWSTNRPSTKSWASPVVANVNNESQVIVSSGGAVTAYSTIDGHEVWSINGLDGNTVPSPVVSGNYLLVGARLPEFANDGDVRANCCLDLSRISNGEPEVVWRADKAICEYSSPVVCGDYAYFLSKANVLHCIDVATGEVAYRERLELDCWATPIVAGSSLYFFAKNGRSRIIQSGPEFREVAANGLWDTENPPKPLAYAEATEPVHGATHGDSGHGSLGGAKHGSGDDTLGTGMIDRMMASDTNGDGTLQADEVPEMFRAGLSRVDSNQDGMLEKAEIEAMAKSFAERRRDASTSARDPIVYGVAAADGFIAVRTGTRLYVIDE